MARLRARLVVACKVMHAHNSVELASLQSHPCIDVHIDAERHAHRKSLPSCRGSMLKRRASWQSSQV